MTFSPLRPSSRLRLGILLLALSAVTPAARGADPIAHPFDPPNFRNQSDLFRSMAAVRKLIREIPNDLAFYCRGLFSKEKWTDIAFRQHPHIAKVYDELFAHRLRRPKNFEKMCGQNSQMDFGSMVNTDYGVCAGLTSMTWLANYVVLFDGEGTNFGRFHPKRLLPKGHTPQSFKALLDRKNSEWMAVRGTEGHEWVKTELDAEDRMILKFFSPFLDRVFREYQPTVVPFFDDLYSFSGHASLMAYFSKLSLETWFEVNVSFSAIREILLVGGNPSKKMRVGEVERLERELRSYLERKIQPVIFIHLPGKNGEEKAIHVIRVIDVGWADRGDDLVVRVVDPNYPAGHDLHRIHFRNIKRDPENIVAVYRPYRDSQKEPDGTYRTLTEVEVMPYFDRMSAEVVRNWARWLDGEGGAILDRLEATAKAKKEKAKKEKAKRAPPERPPSPMDF